MSSKSVHFIHNNKNNMVVLSLFVLLCCCCCCSTTMGYQAPSQKRAVTTDRRQFLAGIATAAGVGAFGILGAAAPAEASYSAYTAREKDWEERQKKGEVKYSTRSDLRKALAEVAPMNSEGSKMFCPNGPSAAVSPLMENRCSDVRVATPSVFGRTDDVLGNSIPGAAAGKGRGGGGGGASSSSLSAAVGGFPAYQKK